MTGPMLMGDGQQIRDWLSLNNAIDEIAGGQVPCRNDPELFFPKKGIDGIDDRAPRESLYVPQAKKACQSCEVVNQCAEYAVKHREEFGIWGGLTYLERRTLWRARDKAAESK